MKHKLYGENKIESKKETDNFGKLVEIQAQAMVSVYHSTCFNVKQLQDILGVGETKVYKLIRSGELPSRTIGRRKVVPVSALAEFLVTNEKGA